MEALFTRSILSYVANDADMHLKNLSALIHYNSKCKTITSVKFSPSYDITTDICGGPEGHRQVLSIEGKKDKFKIKTFMQLAKRLDLFTDEAGNFQEEKAKHHIQNVAKNAVSKAMEIHNDPPIDALSEEIKYDMAVVVSHVVDRAKRLDVDTPSWDSKAVWGNLKEKGLKTRQKKAEKRLSADRPRFQRKQNR